MHIYTMKRLGGDDERTLKDDKDEDEGGRIPDCDRRVFA